MDIIGQWTMSDHSNRTLSIHTPLSEKMQFHDFDIPLYCFTIRTWLIAGHRCGLNKKRARRESANDLVESNSIFALKLRVKWLVSLLEIRNWLRTCRSLQCGL